MTIAHMRLLIIEDNIDFLHFLKLRLEERCFAVDTASTGSLGLTQARTNQYDLVLLDYGLPEMNGYEVCTKLREEGRQMPVIMITGVGEIQHKVHGFNLGVDDYLVKPFYFDELLARIHAMLRRPFSQEQTHLVFEDLSLDTKSQAARRGEVSIYLTRKEFTLLEYFLRHPRAVVSRGEIMDHVWDTELDIFSNTIETHIMNLRKKIHLPKRPKLIHSISGRGYKLDVRK